ncbi:ABC transporter permease [Desulfovibrio sp. JC010]|uniref:ABC transporter permease n=1 Tax=Desulfovibrio sp. JC010 TaxID=2593641 RepID=UPI0013D23D5F|nr:ABC transporter permease [Desulfovibrio sp. JC010]NDV27104.1 FtsX-like permease family protein [Desulfovibrio sp. JC010]
MILGENIKESFRSLMGAKQRSILALIGIVIGIGSVIAMVTVGQIVENEVIRQFKEMGTDICSVQLDGGNFQDRQSFSLENVLKIPQGCPTIRTVSPYVSMYADLKFSGKRTSSPALGVTEQFAKLYKVPISKGRFISDLDGNSAFCVLGSSKVEWLKENGVNDPVGKQVIFDDRIFTVVGTAAAVPMGTFTPYEINEGIMVPIKTALRSQDRPTINTFGARMQESGISELATEQMKRYFKLTAKKEIRVTSAEELVAQMKKQMRMFTALLGAIGSISLIVGGVGVMNVMLVSVSERKKEIGIRRAIGAKGRDIQFQFLVESIILSFIGGMLGTGLGVGATAIICNFANWEFFVSEEAIFLGVGVSAAVGIFFGYYPARQASALSPIDALRS